MNLKNIVEIFKYNYSYIKACSILGILTLPYGLFIGLNLSHLTVWLGYVLIFSVGGLILNNAIKKRISNLRKRIETSSPISWDVALNNVKIGEISDEKYAYICLKTSTDKKTYIAQFLNALWVWLLKINDFIFTIPVAIFWMLFIFAIFEPDTLLNIFSNFSKESLAFQPYSHFVNLCYSWLVLYMTFTGITIFLGHQPRGFINHFANQKNKLIREYLGIAAEGTLILRSFSYTETNADSQSGVYSEIRFSL